jgi:hypothetical protein
MSCECFVLWVTSRSSICDSHKHTISSVIQIVRVVLNTRNHDLVTNYVAIQDIVPHQPAINSTERF